MKHTRVVIGTGIAQACCSGHQNTCSLGVVEALVNSLNRFHMADFSPVFPVYKLKGASGNVKYLVTRDVRRKVDRLRQSCRIVQCWSPKLGGVRGSLKAAHYTSRARKGAGRSRIHCQPEKRVTHAKKTTSPGTGKDCQPVSRRRPFHM